MVYRTIIVHLDTGATCSSRTEIAIRLAREHGSHLIGLAPTGSFELPIDIASTLLEPSLRGASKGHLRELATLAGTAFESLASAAGLSSFEAVVDEADHTASVIAHGVIVSFLQIDTSRPKYSKYDKHLQDRHLWEHRACGAN